MFYKVVKDRKESYKKMLMVVVTVEHLLVFVVLMEEMLMLMVIVKNLKEDLKIWPLKFDTNENFKTKKFAIHLPVRNEDASGQHAYGSDSL